MKDDSYVNNILCDVKGSGLESSRIVLKHQLGGFDANTAIPKSFANIQIFFDTYKCFQHKISLQCNRFFCTKNATVFQCYSATLSIFNFWIFAP